MSHPAEPHAQPAAPAPGPGTSGRLVVAVFGALFLAMLAGSVLAAALLPRVVERRVQAGRASCAERLSAIGVAARQYAQDHGAFPHVRGATELDGDATTTDAPRAWRALVGLGYLETPEALLCPSRPRTRGGSPEWAAWQAWLRTPPDQPTSQTSPTLAECEAVSYAWTRRPLARDAAGSALLAADRAVVPRRGPEPTPRGNHTDGWNALRADGATLWLSVHDEPFPGAWLGRTADPARDGYLSVAPQEDPSLLR